MTTAPPSQILAKDVLLGGLACFSSMRGLIWAGPAPDTETTSLAVLRDTQAGAFMHTAAEHERTSFRVPATTDAALLRAMYVFRSGSGGVFAAGASADTFIDLQRQAAGVLIEQFVAAHGPDVLARTVREFIADLDSRDYDFVTRLAALGMLGLAPGIPIPAHEVTDAYTQVMEEHKSLVIARRHELLFTGPFWVTASDHSAGVVFSGIANRGELDKVLDAAAAAAARVGGQVTVSSLNASQ